MMNSYINVREEYKKKTRFENVLSLGLFYDVKNYDEEKEKIY